jgi:hypothetical protein
MKDTRSNTLRSKLVQLSVDIAKRSGANDLRSLRGLGELEEELDRTIQELEEHEGHEICLRDELDAAPPAQVIAMIEPIRDRLAGALSKATNAQDEAILRGALSAVDAKIEAAVREILADKRNVS